MPVDNAEGAGGIRTEGQLAGEWVRVLVGTALGRPAAWLSLSVALLCLLAASMVLAPAPARAAGHSTRTVNGCVIVAHPDATHFTDCPGANLSGVDLSQTDLAFARFTAANLSGANLVGSVLSHGNLVGATLGACRFLVPPVTEFSCTIADLSGAKLPEAGLSGAALVGVDFSSDDLARSDLSGASFVQCVPPVIYPQECVIATFVGARLTGADLSGSGTSSCLTVNIGQGLGTSYCGGVRMAAARLSGANLSGDDLAWTDLSAANLRGSALTGATLGECAPSIPAAPVCSSTDMAGAKLPRTSLSGLRLNGVHLNGADLVGDDLTGADLSPLLIDGGIARAPSNLDGALLNRANLTKSDLSAASVSGTQFRRVTWSTTTCPDGTNSDTDGGTCLHDLG